MTRQSTPMARSVAQFVGWVGGTLGLADPLLDPVDGLHGAPSRARAEERGGGSDPRLRIAVSLAASRDVAQELDGRTGRALVERPAADDEVELTWCR